LQIHVCIKVTKAACLLDKIHVRELCTMPFKILYLSLLYSYLSLASATLDNSLDQCGGSTSFDLGVDSFLLFECGELSSDSECLK
jgi:hypothetical protein